jgi:hypothetical protein
MMREKEVTLLALMCNASVYGRNLFLCLVWHIFSVVKIHYTYLERDISY